MQRLLGKGLGGSPAQPRGQRFGLRLFPLILRFGKFVVHDILARVRSRVEGTRGTDAERIEQLAERMLTLNAQSPANTPHEQAARSRQLAATAQEKTNWSMNSTA
jgi:hypothetical protein